MAYSCTHKMQFVNGYAHTIYYQCINVIGISWYSPHTYNTQHQYVISLRNIVLYETRLHTINSAFTESNVNGRQILMLQLKNF